MKSDRSAITKQESTATGTAQNRSPEKPANERHYDLDLSTCQEDEGAVPVHASLCINPGQLTAMQPQA